MNFFRCLARHILDTLLNASRKVLNVFRKARVLLLTPNQISRSFWRSRNSQNWNLGNKYPELLEKQTEELSNIFKTKKYIGHSVLDLGCSDGSCSAFVIHDFVHYVKGLDISPAFIKKASEFASKHGINADFAVWDAASAGLPKNKIFDHVMALGLFTCIADDKIYKNILSNIKESLKSGGLLILKDTLAENLDSDKVMSNYLYAAKYRFVNSYVQDFERLGFQKIHVNKLYQFPSEPYASWFFVFQKK